MSLIHHRVVGTPGTEYILIQQKVWLVKAQTRRVSKEINMQKYVIGGGGEDGACIKPGKCQIAINEGGCNSSVTSSIEDQQRRACREKTNGASASAPPRGKLDLGYLLVL